MRARSAFRHYPKAGSCGPGWSAKTASPTCTPRPRPVSTSRRAKCSPSCCLWAQAGSDPRVRGHVAGNLRVGNGGAVLLDGLSQRVPCRLSGRVTGLPATAFDVFPRSQWNSSNVVAQQSSAPPCARVRVPEGDAWGAEVPADSTEGPQQAAGALRHARARVASCHPAHRIRTHRRTPQTNRRPQRTRRAARGRTAGRRSPRFGQSYLSRA